MKYHTNPANPLLYRHYEVVQSAFGRYIRWWSTAINEHMMLLDLGPDSEPAVRKSWWEEE